MAFSSAVFILRLHHDRTLSIFMAPVTFYDLDLETNQTCWPREKIQNGGEYLHDLFSFKSFCICAKNQKIIEYMYIEPLQNVNKIFSCK